MKVRGITEKTKKIFRKGHQSEIWIERFSWDSWHHQMMSGHPFENILKIYWKWTKIHDQIKIGKNQTKWKLFLVKLHSPIGQNLNRKSWFGSLEKLKATRLV